MLTLPLPTYGAHLVANIGANGPLAVALGLCLLRRVDPGVLAAADATGTNKLLLAATTVAMKAHFDDFYVNKYMARIGGLETAKELGELEAHMFLTLLGGRAQVSPGELHDCDRQWRDAVDFGAAARAVPHLPAFAVADDASVTARSMLPPSSAADPAALRRCPPTLPTLRAANPPSTAIVVPFAGLSEADRRRARETGRNIVAALNRARQSAAARRDANAISGPPTTAASVGSDSAFRPESHCSRGHRRHTRPQRGPLQPQ